MTQAELEEQRKLQTIVNGLAGVREDAPVWRAVMVIVNNAADAAQAQASRQPMTADDRQHCCGALAEALVIQRHLEHWRAKANPSAP